MLQPLWRSLIGVMWRVESKIDEKGLGLVFINKLACFLYHEIGKELAIVKNLFAITPKVMLVRTAPVEEVRIVVDTSDQMSEGEIEALAVRDGLLRMPEMPFANMSNKIMSIEFFLMRLCLFA